MSHSNETHDEQALAETKPRVSGSGVDGTSATEPITGQAAGVPFVALPPPIGVSPTSAPVVVGWHLMDPPRTEAAFAAAVPLDGLDAWRIYLGLPMSGSRLPSGGADELAQLGYEDAVLKLHRPVVYGAVDEFPAAFADLREQLGLRAGPVGLLGGSSGAAVALLVLAEADIDVRAAVLISPLVQLRRTVDAMAQRFGFSYPWSADSDAVADRLDFVARAVEIVDRRGAPAISLVVGEQDDAAGFLEPAALLHAVLEERFAEGHRTELVTIPNMAHALADEPGIHPAPQTPHASAVDRQAVRWFQTHLADSDVEGGESA